MAEAPVASRTDGFAELKRQLDAADADIVLVNKRLDESQGMQFLRGPLGREHDARASAIENLRAELARAKEQAAHCRTGCLKGGRRAKSRTGCSLPKQEGNGRDGCEAEERC